MTSGPLLDPSRDHRGRRSTYDYRCEHGDAGAALDKLGVDASGLRTVVVAGAPEVVLAFDVEPASWFDTWQTLRNAVHALTLWPLAICTWGEPLDEIARWDMQDPDGLDATPSTIIARVPVVNVDRLLNAERRRQRKQWLPSDAELAWMLDSTALDGVDLALLHRDLGASPDLLDVERWLLDVELGRGIPHDLGHNDGYLSWFIPDEVVMLLLPTTVPWASGAFVGGYEWGHPHTDLRTALRVFGTIATERRSPPTGAQCFSWSCGARPPRSSRRERWPARSA